MRRIVLVTAAIALAVAGAACGQEATTAGGGDRDHAGHPAGGGDETRQIGGLTANDHGAWDVSNLGEFDLELDDSYFGPTVLMGAAGQELTLSLHNEGDLPHTFTLAEARLDSDVELQPGEEGVTVEVAFPDSGALVFYCRFHRDQGMVGALSVGPLAEGSTGEMTATPGSGYDYG